MASNIEQSPFFQRRKDQGDIVVKDAPKFDLESYIANYAGFTRIERLRHIGSHSPYLAVDAYRLAIAEAKRGKNVALYMGLLEEFSQMAPQDAAAVLDMAWAEKKTRETQQEQDKLEHELKSYKNNLIKESIRMGNEDLGHFFFDTGDYVSAQKAYQKMRENCTSPKHLADMTLRLVYTSIASHSWSAVPTNLAKTEATQLRGEERAKLEPIVSVCHGLTQMVAGSWREAATHFLATSPAYLTAEPVGNIAWQKEILSGNDVAVYGGLCALATMDRTELQNKVLGNSDFRNFLELEPHIRRAISLFCNSKYSACLEVLEGYRNDYLLDVYLSEHDQLSNMYNRIRSKSIVQYFIPFSCVTLDELAAKFPPAEGSTIVGDLVKMIDHGTLDARIDLVDRLLISPPTNPRHNVHADALAMAETYDHTLRLRLTRLNLQAAGMEIKSDKASEKASSHTGDGFSSNMRNLGSKIGF
ncbi:COP9 signalosome-like protein complex subunit 1 [Clathrospora elynae]|uniref:COP9 signalosome complex subunit 1 n=1 Tax=Clathrospora elynae TaxID=706981 RepID=A0A6A5SCC5_9PLEO|nr:COP9 signalosome-like protein complex subunit 1 [Clathrospora elynae]